jgi:undecaprenyl-diphosphatase
MLATAPIVVAGYFLKPAIEHEFRSLTVIALTTIGFGLLLGIADRHSQNRTELTSLRYVEALFIGVMQILALVPGTSRSGITLTAALLLGLNRVHAARFSFLLSIPVIGAASILAIRDASANDIDTNWPHFALGIGLSGVTAYLCITIFLRLIGRTGLMPFVIYRILLGTFLLTLL